MIAAVLTRAAREKVRPFPAARAGARVGTLLLCIPDAAIGIEPRSPSNRARIGDCANIAPGACGAFTEN
jgi:hypothetical protein